MAQFMSAGATATPVAAGPMRLIYAQGAEPSQSAGPMFAMASFTPAGLVHDAAAVPELSAPQMQSLADNLLGTSITSQKRAARGEQSMKQKLASIPVADPARRALLRTLSDEKDAGIKRAAVGPNVIRMTPPAYLAAMIASERAGTRPPKAEETGLQGSLLGRTPKPLNPKLCGIVGALGEYRPLLGAQIPFHKVPIPLNPKP